ncbi:MAG: hypothetical protein WDN27_06225 [Candidatus Saccharibacteria bacterium]
MLNALGKFITKYRWWVIAVWIVAAVGIAAFAPKLSSVESSDQTSFLPSKYQSVQAQKIADKAFPQSKKRRGNPGGSAPGRRQTDRSRSGRRPDARE